MSVCVGTSFGIQIVKFFTEKKIPNLWLNLLPYKILRERIFILMEVFFVT